MSKVFLIADLHFGHFNVMKYENRPFETVEEMDKHMIHMWNQTVKKVDKIFVLGDFSFYNKEKSKEVLSKLNGHKILIMGNHDRSHSVGWWKDAGFNEVYEYPIIYKDFFMFSHEPLYMNVNMPYVNLHGHLHSMQYESKKLYYNVGVELHDYTPIDFEVIKEKLVEYQ
jgi:calcineurin-like phosphoesterase family protein